MPDPSSLLNASFAASGIGNALGGIASTIDRQRMYDAFRQQQLQQQGFAQQGQGIINQRLATAGAGPAQQQMGQAQQQRIGDYANIQNVPLSVTSTPNYSTLLAARDAAQAGLQGQARAKLGSYGDWLQNQWVSNQQTGRALGNVEQAAGGSASVFPYQMYDAQHSMDNLALLGQAIQSLGGGGLNYLAIQQAMKQRQQQGQQQQQQTPQFDPNQQYDQFDSTLQSSRSMWDQ